MWLETIYIQGSIAMKKIISFFLILSCIVITPVTAYAATESYRISATKEITMIEGESVKLTLPSKYKNIKWTSSDKDIATISKKGTLTAVSHGEATITAKSGKKKFKCIIVVWTGEEEIIYEEDISEVEDIPSNHILTPDAEFTY